MSIRKLIVNTIVLNAEHLEGILAKLEPGEAIVYFQGHRSRKRSAREQAVFNIVRSFYERGEVNMLSERMGPPLVRDYRDGKFKEDRRDGIGAGFRYIAVKLDKNKREAA